MVIRIKLFRTIVSDNQLRICGAVSDLCEEYKSCPVGTKETCFGRTIWPVVFPDKFLDENTYTLRLLILRKKIWCKSSKSEWTSFHNKIVWLNSAMMQVSWQRLTSDSTSWKRTLTSSYNLPCQWRVVSTLCHEMKIQLTRKVGFEGTQNRTRAGSHNPVASNEKDGVEKRIESANKHTSHSWVWISHGLNKIGHRLDRQRVRRYREGKVWNEDGSICVCKGWNTTEKTFH